MTDFIQQFCVLALVYHKNIMYTSDRFLSKHRFFILIFDIIL